MALPKGYRKNLSVLPKKFGKEQREELLSKITDNGTFLPRGVMPEDMDKSFVEFVEKDLEITIEGEKVPVIFLTLQRWSEFSRTWKFSGEDKDIKMPFITIVRKPDIQPGTNQQSLWNTAARLDYTYMQIPTFDGIRKGVDVYKIPQSVAIDLNYEVRLFCNKMRDLNIFHIKTHKVFQSRQFYITPNEHPMPVVLESIGDESPINDFENRRFYVQLYEMQLKGLMLDENDFKVIPAKNRALMLYEADEKIKAPILRIKADKDTSLINYNLIFKPFAANIFTTEIGFDIKFTEITPLLNISSLVITLNNNVVTVPFVATSGDEITFTTVRPGNLEGRFVLKGYLL